MDSSSDSSSIVDFEEESTISEEENMSNNVVVSEQWIKTIDFCSVQSKSSKSVTKGIGVQKLCGATDANFVENDQKNNGWILENKNNSQECLIVSFESTVFINQIHIYESLNPGSIVKLEMLEPTLENWLIMWQRKTPREKKSITHNIFKPLLRCYHIQSATIRITLDPTYADLIGIQAIKLVGSNVFNTYFNHRTLSLSMNKLYEQAVNNVNTDVEFIFNDKKASAHRNILCCRSTFFRSLLLSDFIEKSQKNPIELSDIDYETFLEILYFIYTGTYHQTISCELAIKSMIYTNKINLITGKNAAIEHICRHLRSNRQPLINIYCLVKELSPTFDSLLDYIYDLCSEHLSDICKQQDFIELEKELMVDLVCRASERRETREQEKIKQITLLQNNSQNNEGEEEEEEEEE